MTGKNEGTEELLDVECKMVCPHWGEGICHHRCVIAAYNNGFNKSHPKMDTSIVTFEQFHTLVLREWDQTYGRFVLLTDRELCLSTGGWSVNEDALPKLQATMFWYLHWTKTERGGHYYFENIHGVSA